MNRLYKILLSTSEKRCQQFFKQLNEKWTFFTHIVQTCSKWSLNFSSVQLQAHIKRNFMFWFFRWPQKVGVEYYHTCLFFIHVYLIVLIHSVYCCNFRTLLWIADLKPPNRLQTEFSLVYSDFLGRSIK